MTDVETYPFCAGPAKTRRWNGTLQASCAKPHTECAGADIEVPVPMWNRRAPAKVPQEVVGWYRNVRIFEQSIEDPENFGLRKELNASAAAIRDTLRLLGYDVTALDEDDAE